MAGGDGYYRLKPQISTRGLRLRYLRSIFRMMRVSPKKSITRVLAEVVTDRGRAPHLTLANVTAKSSTASVVKAKRVDGATCPSTRV
jgi:hypothetical protein